MLRQQIERAKDILVKRLGASEAEAHKALQRSAQWQRQTLGEAAAQLIEADGFFVTLDGA